MDSIDTSTARKIPGRGRFLQSPFLVRAVLITGATGLFSAALGFANSALVARLLGPEGLGVVEAIFLLPSEISTFVLLAAHVGIVYFAQSDPDHVREYQSSGYAFIVAISVLVVLMLLLFGRELSGVLFRDDSSYSGLAVLTIAFSSALFLLNSGAQTLALSERRIILYNIAALAYPLVKLVGLLPAALLLQNRVEWVVGVQLLALISVHAILVKVIRETVSIRHIRLAALLRILRFSSREYWGNVLQKLNFVLDKFLIALFLSKTELGLYGVAVLLAQLPWLIPSMITPVLLVHVSGSKSTNDDELTFLVARFVLWSSLLAALGLFLAANVFVRVVYGTEFTAAARPLVLLLPGTAAMSFSKVLTRLTTGKGHPQANSFAAAISFVVNIVALYLLLPTWGIAGAALASSITYLLFTFVMLTYLRLVMKLPISYNFIFRRTDLRFIGSLLARTFRS